MNAQLIPFEFEGSPFRVIMDDDEPWFVVVDLCTILGLTNATEVVKRLDNDEKGLRTSDTPGGPQELTVVSEPGLYIITLRSQNALKPGTVPYKFRRWLTHEVLPALRKYGRYEMPGLEPAPVQAIDLDPIRLTAGTNVVRLAMRLYGPAAARGLWSQVGLPPVIADAEAVIDTDPLAVPLQAYLQDRMETTIQQAAEGMGLHDLDWSTRYRIGKLLKLWGWTQRQRKVAKHRTARVFSRPASGVTIDQDANLFRNGEA